MRRHRVLCLQIQVTLERRQVRMTEEAGDLRKTRPAPMHRKRTRAPERMRGDLHPGPPPQPLDELVKPLLCQPLRGKSAIREPPRRLAARPDHVDENSTSKTVAKYPRKTVQISADLLIF